MIKEFLTALPEDSLDHNLPLPDQKLFQEKVGSMLYLASQTRPDLLYSITQLS
jgi:hypothetical protein